MEPDARHPPKAFYSSEKMVKKTYGTCTVSGVKVRHGRLCRQQAAGVNFRTKILIKPNCTSMDAPPWIPDKSSGRGPRLDHDKRVQSKFYLSGIPLAFLPPLDREGPLLSGVCRLPWPLSYWVLKLEIISGDICVAVRFDWPVFYRIPDNDPGFRFPRPHQFNHINNIYLLHCT